MNVFAYILDILCQICFIDLKAVIILLSLEANSS